MSIAREMLEELLKIELNYKGIPVNIFGTPKFKSYNKYSVKSAAYGLSKREFVSSKCNILSITSLGKKYLSNTKPFKHFKSPFKKDEPKNTILMFDIPTEKRKYRDWLRNQLKEFGYEMIQKSVWIGPSPLPKEFKAYAKELKIEKAIKTFKLSRGLN